jgi:hypothetical protein
MRGGGGDEADNRSRCDVARVVQSHGDSREADREREPEDDGAGPATDEEHGESECNRLVNGRCQGRRQFHNVY